MAIRDDGRTERPILFNGEMVRAVLDGRKTQTRRVVKATWPEDFEPPHRLSDGRWVVTDNRPPDVLKNFDVRCPYGKPGDLLWVRETWAPFEVFNDPNGGIHYREGHTSNGRIKWKPSIHMPRWASRILLEVTSVRVERVQEISAGDCIAEGINADLLNGPLPFDDFRILWDSINGKKPGRSWEDNPWVWVVEFKRVDP